MKGDAFEDERHQHGPHGPTSAQLALIYDTVSDSIMLFAAEPAGPRLLSVNAAFARQTGFLPSQIAGKLLVEIADKPVRPSRFRDAVDAVIRDKTPARFEEHIEWRGRRMSALVNITPILDDAGNCTHVL